LVDSMPHIPTTQGQQSRIRYSNGRQLTIALAGNANVGKSAIFNQLTGLVQETGNWSGKTAAVREGTLIHHGMQINIIDLPGIYSFSVYSSEELITRDYILTRHPDVVINVLDANLLERNLFFTLQLKEMDIPLVVALNFSDIARKKHIHTNITALSDLLGSPVIDTIAIKGIGVHELVDAALDVVEKNGNGLSNNQLKYGTEVESRISQLEKEITIRNTKYPPRWTAIALLAGDSELVTRFDKELPELVTLAKGFSSELTAIHGEDNSSVITAERYTLAARIAREVSIISSPGTTWGNRLDNLVLHPVIGYVLFFITMAAILVFISLFGGWITGIITNLFNNIDPHLTGRLGQIFWNGTVVGFYAALAVGLGFILPFFLILSWLGESGYLPRIAFLMDRPCHTVGLHGQASLPLITALGCNVPACLACRVMDNKRDRLLAIFLSTLVPCSARTSVVLGLVGAFIGWQWAVGLLVFQFTIIFVVGWIVNRLNPSRSPGIIMEIPEYRVPDIKIVWKQAWYRFKDFLMVGVPFIVIGSAVIESLRIFSILDDVTRTLTPITVSWLGLPAFTGVLLIFGILRKEANLALLISLAGGATITSIISPLQMVVLSIVVMLYIPCISTMAVMVKEIGVKYTVVMVVTETVLALLIGGISFRVLGLFLA
jgi:ferrous iron transport protein B